MNKKSVLPGLTTLACLLLRFIPRSLDLRSPPLHRTFTSILEKGKDKRQHLWFAKAGRCSTLRGESLYTRTEQAFSKFEKSLFSVCHTNLIPSGKSRWCSRTIETCQLLRAAPTRCSVVVVHHVPSRSLSPGNVHYSGTLLHCRVANHQQCTHCEQMVSVSCPLFDRYGDTPPLLSHERNPSFIISRGIEKKRKDFYMTPDRSR